MSLLIIFDEKTHQSVLDLSDHDAIQAELAKIDVEFQRWDTLEMLTEDKKLTDERILDLYKNEIKTIKDLYHFHQVDIINVTPEFAESEKFEPMRNKFLNEHIHTDHEVRYFIDGLGLFYIHKESKVYGILCSAGDFISVPANTRHWFDMGTSPNFKCIRFFTSEEGWVPEYVTNAISSNYPLLDQFANTTV